MVMERNFIRKQTRETTEKINLQEIERKYSEASAFAGVAASVWNGGGSPAKVEMAVTGRLHAELTQLLGKDIRTVFLTDSGATVCTPRWNMGTGNRRIA